MKQGASSRKVNEQAREVIASIMLFDISDPRLRLVTITGCEVSFDRSYCNVYYTAERGSYESTAEAFRKATGRIRSLMARQLSWRVAPELRFILDTSVDEAERISTALNADYERNADSAAKNAEREAAEAAAAEAAAFAAEDDEWDDDDFDEYDEEVVQDDEER